MKVSSSWVLCCLTTDSRWRKETEGDLAFCNELRINNFIILLSAEMKRKGSRAKSNLFPLAKNSGESHSDWPQRLCQQKHAAIHSGKIASELQRQATKSILPQPAAPWSRGQARVSSFTSFTWSIGGGGVCNKVNEPLDFPAVWFHHPAHLHIGHKSYRHCAVGGWVGVVNVIVLFFISRHEDWNVLFDGKVIRNVLKAALHQFNTQRWVNLSWPSLLSLWKQLYNFFCGSGGSFLSL